jgi:OmcA/MtrC family decaheme c-type cytochrome
VVFSLNSKNGPIDPATLDRLLFVLTGPNEDFEFYAQENVIGGLTAVEGGWSYTFSTAIPSGAKGSYSVGYEGRITTEVNGSDERDSAENALFAVAVTDSSAEPRRMIVDDAKCEACHSNLSLHGDNRKNAGEYCQTCHRPDATDEEVRLEGEAEGIHFKYMIHKIHRGAELENLPYIVYGYRSSVVDYSDVHFPGDLRDCESCHMDDTYTIDAIPDTALPTHSPAAAIPDMEPITATCLSCHDSDATASHALANSSDLGESCATCHGDGKTYSVERVHAR